MPTTVTPAPPAAPQPIPRPTTPDSLAPGQDTFGTVLARIVNVPVDRTTRVNRPLPLPADEDRQTDRTNATPNPAAVPGALPPTNTPASPAQEPSETESRTQQLRFRQSPAADQAPAPANQPEQPAPPPPAAPPTATTPANVAAPDLTPIASPTAAATPAGAATEAAVRLPAIPAQAPIVSDLTVPPAAPPLPLELASTPVAAAGSVAPLPNVQVGDRPATAGERFAAIAQLGAGLATVGAPAAGPSFDTVLADADRDRIAAGAVANAAAPAITPQAPTAQAPAQTAAPAGAQIADEVIAHAHTLERPGAVEFRMRLDPPELGRVRVHLVASGDEVRGQVVVADDAVRRLIESQLPELRQRLEAAGVTVQQFDVTADPERGGYRPPERDDTPTVAAAAAKRPATARPASGTLDVTV